MTVSLALYQPDIAQNTGTLIRLGACLGITVHIIHPTGFVFSRKTLARSGLDYLDHAMIIEHASYTEFDAWRRTERRRLVLLTTKAETSAYDVGYDTVDILMLGRESAGVPPSVAKDADLRVRIPMGDAMRSLNVAIAAGLVLGEALRQTGHFETLA
jgi:tRNA (cytidine/uridine-2'-O-)-methyltransferase